VPDAAYYRERAQTCRQLATSIDEHIDPKMRKAVLTLADEYDPKAETLNMLR
jgi:hypothetical protein